MGPESKGEQGFRPEDPEIEKKTEGKWQWPLIEGKITPEKKKKFWEELFALRPYIRTKVSSKIGRLVPTSEVDLVTDKIIQKLFEKIDSFNIEFDFKGWAKVVIMNAIEDARRTASTDILMKGMPNYRLDAKENVVETETAFHNKDKGNIIENLRDMSPNPEDILLLEQKKIYWRFVK